MKNLLKTFGIIAFIAVIGFSMAACGGGDGDDLQTVTYTGRTEDGQTYYTLRITENPMSRYAAQSGDDYELTSGAKRSNGKVVGVFGGELTLSPSNNPSTFTATVSESGLTALKGTITWSNGEIEPAPSSSLTGQGSSSGGGGGSSSLAGTKWECTETLPGVGSVTFTLTFTASTVKMEWLGQTENGTYTVKGSSINIQWNAGYTGSGSFTVNGERLIDSEGHIFIKQNTGGGGGGGGGGGEADPVLNGTWVMGNETCIFNNGSFEGSIDGSPVFRGTYTTSNGSITINITGLYGGHPEFAELRLASKWYSRDEFKTQTGASDADLNKIFLTTTEPYSVYGTTLTWGGEIYTKNTDGGGGGGGGDSGSGGLTVTGIPSKYEGKYAGFSGSTGNVTLTGYQTKTSTDILLPQIQNGRVTIPLWDMRTITNPSTWVKYTGNDTFMFGTVLLYNSGSYKVTQSSSQQAITTNAFIPITFSNGNATVSWNDGMEIPQ